MNALFDRVRGFWDGLNDRERRLVGALAAVVVVFTLGFPLVFTATENSSIEGENAELRAALDLIGKHRAELQQWSEARRTSSARYARRTPPLGTFLEKEAEKQGLTIREITDQPEKAEGNYHRRSVTASINDSGLTGIMNLLSALARSEYPVAVDQIQIEHYQPGDSYRFKLGVLTFDKTRL